MNTKQKVLRFVEAFLTAYALTHVVESPLYRYFYEQTTDYVTANLSAVLGKYNFSFVLIFLLAAFFYCVRFPLKEKVRTRETVAAVGFSVLLLLGQCYKDFNTFTVCFATAANVLVSLLIVTGYSILLLYAIDWLNQTLSKQNVKKNNVSERFTKHPLLFSFLILFSVYTIAIVLSFPGNMNYDTVGQIMQVLGTMEWSTHHPLVASLFIGGIVKFGLTVFGSYEAGIFIYCLVQAAMLSLALSFTIVTLYKKGASKGLLLTLLLLYLVTPGYLNIVSTAIKDVPFLCFVIGYMICLSNLVADVSVLSNRKFILTFIAMQLGMMLFRNNGLYMVVLTGIVLFIAWFKKLSARERISLLVVSFAGSVLLAKLISGVLADALHAEKGRKAEMFSLPFQITARYMQTYMDETPQDELAAIEAVVGDVSRIADRYNPNLADAVKMYYVDDATASDLIRYFAVFTKEFARHPGVCADGFLNHVYGWFCPNVSTTIRYEMDQEELYSPTEFSKLLGKVQVFFFRYLDATNVLGVLQNSGFATWALIYLCMLLKRFGQKDARLTLVPLWVALLVCMASPASIEHPRYGYPILMSLPFLFAFWLCNKEMKHE